MKLLLENKITITVLILIIFVLSFFHFRGIFYPDEGYVLNTAQRIIGGQALYSDFDFVYTPLAPFIMVFGFSLFGESIFSSRLIALLLSLTTVTSIFFITKILTKKKYYSLFVILIYLSWGPSHINFIWPSIVSLTIGTIALAAFLYNKPKTIVLSGFFAFLVFMTKQNLGIAVILAFFTYILVQKDSKILKQFLLGVFAGIGVFFFYLITTNSLNPFITNFYHNVILKIVIEKTIDTPILYSDSIYSYMKLAFYLSPLLVGIYSLIITFKQRSNLALLPLFTTFFYLAGFRPVTDYVHLSPLIAATGLSLLPIFLLEKDRLRRKFVFVYAGLLIIMGFYTALFYGYYRWEAPLSSSHQLVANPRVYIWLNDKYQREVPEVLKIVDEKTNPGDKVFINYYAPMLYFLIERDNPTAYDYLSPSALSEESKRKLLESLSKEKVRLIVTHDLNSNPEDIVNEYIIKNYRKVDRVNDLTFWEVYNAD